jgi:hypothetical protein
MRASAAGLRDQCESRIEVGNRPILAGQALTSARMIGETPLDPWCEFGNRCGGSALGRARRQDDLDTALRVDPDAHSARPRCSADAVGNRWRHDEARYSDGTTAGAEDNPH